MWKYALVAVGIFWALSHIAGKLVIIRYLSGG